MASRLTTVEKIEILLMHGEFKTFHEVHRQCKKRFSTEPSAITTIRNLLYKFKETDSVHNKKRSERSHSIVTEEIVEKVKKMLVKSIQTSFQSGAREFGISKDSFHRAAREIDFRP